MIPLLNHLAMMLHQEHNLDAFPRGGPPSPAGGRLTSSAWAGWWYDEGTPARDMRCGGPRS